MGLKDIPPHLKGPAGNGGGGNAQALQMVQPLGDMQFVCFLSVLLPDFDVPNPEWQAPTVDGPVGTPARIPADLGHRIGRALQHIENVSYLARLGEIASAVNNGVRRADAQIAEAVAAEQRRVAEEDARIDAERLFR